MQAYACGTGNGTTYRYFSGEPDIPFGFGLSKSCLTLPLYPPNHSRFEFSELDVSRAVGYTTFTYTNLKFNATTIGPCDSIRVTVDVFNSADGVDADEVVQLYVKTPGASVKAPRVRLADFARVAIAAGETANVELVVAPKYFSVVKNEGNSRFWHPQIVVEAGDLELSVGGGQPDFTGGVLKGKVTVKDSGPLTTHYAC